MIVILKAIKIVPKMVDAVNFKFALHFSMILLSEFFLL